MLFEFGDIVLVPFPFTDQTAQKKRPAVVVSTTAYKGEKPDLILMAVTSQLRPTPTLGDVWLADWQRAGLLKPSAAKPVLATIEQRLILRQLVVLTPQDSHAVRQALSDIVG